MSERADGDFLRDIREAVRRIRAYTDAMTYDYFLADIKTQDAVIHNLEIMGEAAKSLSTGLREKYRDVPWKGMAGVRDRLIHHYFGVNLDIVWDIVTVELPALELQVGAILQQEYSGGLQSEIPPTENHPNVVAGIVTRFGQVVILLGVQAAILFLAAGRLNWTWAWVFLGIYLVSVSINSAFMLRTSPETVAERGRPTEMKDWDKVVGGLWSLAQFLVLPLVSALDVRFGWTREISAAWHIAGTVVFAVGLGLFGWAMITNVYFSTVVRVQSDRGHRVCRTGPYRFVRHPGYVGAVLQSLGIPFLLGSLWALIPGITAAVLMIIRTSLEDHTLQAELPGYREFVQEVRYRLVPGIW